MEILSLMLCVLLRLSLTTWLLHCCRCPLVYSSNSVGVAYTDDGQPYGGRGGAVYNGGESSTILFNRLAVFHDNVGALVRSRSGGSIAVLLVDARAHTFDQWWRASSDGRTGAVLALEQPVLWQWENAEDACTCFCRAAGGR